MKRKLILPIVVVLGVVLGIYAASFSNVNTVSTASGNGFKFDNQVCVSKNGVLLGCSHNTFTTAGKSLVMDYLFNASATQLNWVKYIAVGNGTAPAAGSTTLDSEIAECGFSRAIATSVYTNATAGVRFIEKVFTMAGCAGTVVVNTTGLFNQTATGTLFAGNSFTDASLQNNDQLNITWTVAVTGT